MIKRRILFAVTALFVVGGAGIARAAEQTPATNYPDDRGQRALDALHAPSIPTRLPDSTDAGGGLSQASGSCDTARAAYQASDAPVPADAKITVQGPSLVVHAPLGDSIIDFTDHGSTCLYRIARGPTVMLDGGGFDKVTGLTRVGCALDTDSPYVAGTVSTPQGDVSFAAVKGGVFGGNGDMKGSVGAVKPGGVGIAFNTATKLDTANVTITSADENGGTLSITTDQGPVTVTYRCTIPLGDLIHALSPNGSDPSGSGPSTTGSTETTEANTEGN